MDVADKPTWTYSRRVPHRAAPPAPPTKKQESCVFTQMANSHGISSKSLFSRMKGAASKAPGVVYFDVFFNALPQHVNASRHGPGPCSPLPAAARMRTA